MTTTRGWASVLVETSDEDLETFLEGHPGVYSAEAFRDYIMYTCPEYLDEAIQNFEDAYQGQWNDMESFAWDFYERTDVSGPVPPGFRLEVDLDVWECDYWISPNGHVFDKNV